MWSVEKGNTVLKGTDTNSSSCMLKDTLLVPNLGINLMSARQFCKDKEIKGHFDHKDMFLKRKDKVLVHARQHKGLYIVKNVSKEAKDKAFSARVKDEEIALPAAIDSDPEIGDSSATDPDDSKEEAETRNQRRHYRLMHRRFGHYGAGMLRKLHEVASGVKKIKIPPPHKRICEHCKIGKMRRKISKRMTPLT